MNETGEFTKALQSHEALSQRKSYSEKTLAEISASLALQPFIAAQCSDVAIFCAGSLGRLDSGQLSDWDVFIISNRADDQSRLFEIEILAALVNVNRNLNFQPFSNDGKYLKVHYAEDIAKSIGKPEDDSQNTFTARMLLLLESRCIWREPVYNTCIHSVLRPYYRDSQGRGTFFLLFLLNDLLRYWRTLCLNYELIRVDPNWPWRKKNINLKFSRLLTVFSTVLAIISEAVKAEDDVHKLVQLTPLQRVAKSLDYIDDMTLIPRFKILLDDYEQFLSWKDSDSIEEMLSTQPFHEKRIECATRFSVFFHDILMHPKVKDEYKRYLVI